MKIQFYLTVLIVALIQYTAQAQIISTVYGTTSGYSGDGGAASSAQMDGPCMMTYDDQGNLYFAEYDNNVVRRIDVNGIISTVAGNGTPGYSGDGGPATSAQLSGPYGVAIDANGDLYISEILNHTVRKVDFTTGIITTNAGNGVLGYSGDGGAATSAQLNGPYGIAFDVSGNLFIAERDNSVIRKVNTSGTISTFAGTGAFGYFGDGGLATSAQFAGCRSVTFNDAGEMFISDGNNHVIRKINVSGVVSTVAGNGGAGHSGDCGQAVYAQLNFPRDVIFDAVGNMYISESTSHVIRKVNTSGIISTVGGNATSGYSGDGGLATLAQLNQPYGILFDDQGNLLVADRSNNVIRKITSLVTLQSVQICSGDSYTYPDGVTQNNITSDVTHHSLLVAGTLNCDSTVITTVMVGQNYILSETVDICSGSDYTFPDGTTQNNITSSMVHTSNLSTVGFGCDSIITTTLSVNSVNTTVTQNGSFLNADATQSSYQWLDCSNGNSVIPGQTNQFFQPQSSGSYAVEITSLAGCVDTSSCFNACVSTSSVSSMTACESYTSPSGNYNWTASGTYQDTLQNASGCDSVLTINLTITNPSASVTSIAACDSYLWTDGNTYTNSGIYTQNLVNSAGCDSIATLNLTIGNSSLSSISPVACGSYTSPSGNYNWTISGTYLDTLTTVSGCDSIITINLTVNTVDVSITSALPIITANATGASYQWLDCYNNTVLTGETDQSLNVTANGLYAVEVTQNGCTDTSECLAVFSADLEQKNSDQLFTGYPNPTNGDFTVELGSVYSNIEVRIKNSLGQEVNKLNFVNESNVLIDIIGVPGIYFLEIRADDKRALLKVVKK